jgi:hypothetical protein
MTPHSWYLPIKQCRFLSAKRVQTYPSCAAQVCLCVLQLAYHNIEMDGEEEEERLEETYHVREKEGLEDIWPT